MLESLREKIKDILLSEVLIKKSRREGSFEKLISWIKYN